MNLGFCIGKGTYLKDNWNVLDFIIVLFSVLNWILNSLSDIDVSFVRSFRALRALRPLRLVSKNEGMKTVVNSLLKSIPQLINVMLISLLFYMVFGILGVQIFRGSFGNCSDESVMYKRLCTDEVVTLDDGSQYTIERKWEVPYNNYDDVMKSMVTFFEISTLEMWPDVMWRAIDSQGHGKGPSKNKRVYMAVIFVVFIFVTTFFVMNLFISVIVDRFNEEIKKKEGQKGLTMEQKEWVKIQRIIVTVNTKILPQRPTHSKFRSWCYDIVKGKDQKEQSENSTSKFEYFILLCIVFNTVFLCLEYYNAPPMYQRALDTGNNVFVVIFTIEAFLKISAHGISYYWHIDWNKFDLIIVILSLVSIYEGLFSFNVTALRIIRVARLLRMIKTSKGLRHLLKTLYMSLGNIMNVGLLMFLIFFTFAVAGMGLFGTVKHKDFINENANFETFYMAIITLFRASTGESWNGIMHDCS